MVVFVKIAENESGSEKSYDSDDSEINYVREYVRSEVEEGTFISDHEEHVPSLTEVDPDTYKPYEDEPIASEEWLSEYGRRAETQLEFERKLLDRYEGTQLITSW